MEQQTITTIENTLTETEQDFFEFANLELTDEQLAEIKGGIGECPAWRCGFNHNETTAADEADETAALDDLPVEDDEQVKGGWSVIVVTDHGQTRRK